MSAGGGRRAVVAALLANLSIAVAKFVGFLITGSTAMLAEGVHSVADSGNQALLLVGGRRAARPADEEHPFGYGRERYFWAFVVALVLFMLGGVFSLYQGVKKLEEAGDAEALNRPGVAIAILLFALVAESLSFRTAVRESRPVRGSRSWWQFVRQTKSPELPVVLLEDLGALAGLVLALVGVALAAATGDLRWDALGSLAIGTLLLLIAALLVYEMRSLLLGESATREDVEAISGALVDGRSVLRVIHLRTSHLGPDELLVAAKIAVAPALTLREVATAIDDAEARVRAVVPTAVQMYLEPDVDRGPAGGGDPAGRERAHT